MSGAKISPSHLKYPVHIIIWKSSRETKSSNNCQTATFFMSEHSVNSKQSKSNWIIVLELDARSAYTLNQEHINYRTGTKSTPHIRMGRMSQAVSHKLDQVLRVIVL